MMMWALLLSFAGVAVSQEAAIPTLFAVNAAPECPEMPPSQSVCSQVLCLFGQMKDDNGCLSCQCIDPCTDIMCPANMKCLAQTELCKEPPCQPLAMAHCVDMAVIERPAPRSPSICERQPTDTASTVVVPDVFQGCVLSRSFPQTQTSTSFGGPSPAFDVFPPRPPTGQVRFTTRYFRENGDCRVGYAVGNCTDANPVLRDTFPSFQECMRLCEPVKDGVCPGANKASLAIQPCTDSCLTDYSCSGFSEKCCPNKCGTGNVCVQSEPDRNAVPDPVMRCPIRSISVFTPRENCNFTDFCSDCQDGQLCCTREDGCGVECTEPISLEYRYTCPAVIDVGGDCEDACENDDDCEFFQRCCDNGCGKRCATRMLRLFDPSAPDTVIGVNEDKSGTCPLPVLGREPLCSMTCRYDGQCPGEEKCCSNGCGMHCSGSSSFNGALEVKEEFPVGIQVPVLVDPIFLSSPADAAGFPGFNSGGSQAGQLFPSSQATGGNFIPGPPSPISSPVPSPLPMIVRPPAVISGQPVPGMPGMVMLPGFPPMGVPDNTTGSVPEPSQNTTQSNSTLLPGMSITPIQMVNPPPQPLPRPTNAMRPMSNVSPPAGSKSGICPPFFHFYGDKCAKHCSGDADCRGMTKCCSNGCGRFCVKPFGMGPFFPPPNMQGLGKFPFGKYKSRCKGRVCLRVKLGEV